MGQIRYIRMLAIWVVGTAATTAYAQGLTYNHDPAKKNQNYTTGHFTRTTKSRQQARIS